MNTAVRALLLVYALGLVAGGAMGYAKAGSLASLIAGAASGLAAGAGFALSLRRPRAGFAVSLVVAVVLAIAMGRRFLAQEPRDYGSTAFLIASLSVAMAFVLVAGILAARPPAGGRGAPADPGGSGVTGA
ncbi:MAG: hypothetical protein HY721_28415 [Planctomycetes bacterium]|nr:hypothetical protein [Planctomycetota bacterium]